MAKLEKFPFQFEFIEYADVKVEKEKLLKLMAVKELGMPMAQHIPVIAAVAQSLTQKMWKSIWNVATIS